LMDAFYEEGLFTNGLNTIQTDPLHVYEEGINVLTQTMLLDYGDPKVVERIMETCRAYERITGINDRGVRQVRSTFFSGTKLATEKPWSKLSQNYGHLIFHPALSLVEYNGHPATKKLLLELADGVLSYMEKDDRGNYYIPGEIAFPSGESSGRGMGVTCHLLWGAYRWTGDDKYLLPITGAGGSRDYGSLGSINANMLDLLDKRATWGSEIGSRSNPHSARGIYSHIAWQVTGNKQFIEENFAGQIAQAARNEYLNTDGHFWTDRAFAGLSSDLIQRQRLGGAALIRNRLYPGHAVSWEFKAPASSESVAILIPDATTKSMTVIAYNLETSPVTAVMTGWDIDPGEWEVTEGIDADGDDVPESVSRTYTVTFERTKSMELLFRPRTTTIIRLKLKSKGTPYWRRPDLGIGEDDVRVDGSTVRVTVHSLGSVAAPESSLALVDSNGKILATATVPALEAPLDFVPKTSEVTLRIPAGSPPSGCMVRIDPDEELTEITTLNNQVEIP